MLGFNRFAVVGDEVRFLYLKHGRTRIGRVVEIGKTFVRLKTSEGFRSFSFMNIFEFENLSV